MDQTQPTSRETHMKHIKTIVGGLAVAAALASASLAAAGADHDSDTGHSAPETAADQAELATANLAAAAFQDVEVAEAAGYASTLDTLGCFENPEAGGMGLHYLNESLMDGTVDVTTPEALVYELDADGAIVGLVAHEYIVPVEAWSSEAPPNLFGVDFHQHADAATVDPAQLDLEGQPERRVRRLESHRPPVPRRCPGLRRRLALTRRKHAAAETHGSRSADVRQKRMATIEINGTRLEYTDDGTGRSVPHRPNPPTSRRSRRAWFGHPRRDGQDGADNRAQGRAAMTHVGEHAVVLGASLAGLAAAAALAERFDRVTIVERDTLPVSGECRRGIPQGRHVHILLPAGLVGLSELLPGVVEDLRARDARVMDTTEVRFHIADGSLLLDDADLEFVGATRPLLESVVRDRVRALSGVRLLEDQDARGLLTTPDRSRVTGVRLGSLDSNTEEALAGDLVVDATGRSSPSPRWVADLGYPSPGEERLQVGIHYTTRLFRREPGDLEGLPEPRGDDSARWAPRWSGARRRGRSVDRDPRRSHGRTPTSRPRWVRRVRTHPLGGVTSTSSSPRRSRSGRRQPADSPVTSAAGMTACGASPVDMS